MQNWCMVQNGSEEVVECDWQVQPWEVCEFVMQLLSVDKGILKAVCKYSHGTLSDVCVEVIGK